MIKVRCQFCNTWCGNMELKIAKGTEWEIIATCPDCLKREKEAPRHATVDELRKMFGMDDSL